MTHAYLFQPVLLLAPLPLAAVWPVAALLAAVLWAAFAFWRSGARRVTAAPASMQNPSAVQLDTIARIHRQREELDALSREIAERIDPRIAELRDLVERGEALADRLERAAPNLAKDGGLG